MNEYDQRFFHAIAVGALAGALGLWMVLTGAFYFLTDQTLATVAAFCLVPGVFCGPFVGGLFTTALAGGDVANAEVVALPVSTARSGAKAA